jgi:hypothetical protein
MFPVTRDRVNNHVVMIHMMELPRGFGVASYEALPITSLPSEEIKQGMRDKLMSLQVSEPESIFCVVVIRVEVNSRVLIGCLGS